MDSGSIKRTPLTAIGAITIHPERQNISFGRWAIPVMAQKMQDPDPLDRKRAVQSLCDYVFDSRRVASKEFETVVPHLKSVTQDENNEVRLKVAECFGAIAASAAGRQTYEKYDFYEHILKMTDDGVETVRQAVLTAVQRVCLSPVGAESMVKAGTIEKLLGRLSHESDTALVPLLQALHSCCLVDPERAMEVNGLDVLIPLLRRPYPKVRERAATIIKDLTIEAKGRNRALELFAVPLLTELCLDEDNRVKAKALAALMMITNATAGKYEALENEAIEKIFPLLKSRDVEIRLNAVKVLTALGEAPEGRENLMQNYRMILRLLNDEYEEVQNATNKLIKVVTFTP